MKCHLGCLGTPWNPMGILGTPWDPMESNSFMLVPVILSLFAKKKWTSDLLGPLRVFWTPWDPFGPLRTPQDTIKLKKLLDL